MPLRLQKLRNGHTWLRKLQFLVMPWMMGFPASGVIKTLTYRPTFFGNPFSDVVQSALRGPSFWTVAERELFAGWVSARNQCMF
jgi:hypothetical protein